MALSPVRAGLTVAQLFVRRSVLRTRSLLVLFLIIADVIVAFAYRASGSFDIEHTFAALTNETLLGFVVPFMALLYGVAVIRDEEEQGTITYLLLHPISRPTLYLGRLFIACTITTVIALSCLTGHLLILGESPETQKILTVCGALVLGSIAYTTLFSAIGTIAKRPFVIGLIVLLLGDLPLSQLPMAARHVTLRANLENIAGLAPERTGITALLDTSLSTGTSILILVSVAATSLLLGLWAFQNREYTGEVSE